MRFRLIALPGGLAFFIVPALIYFLIPESPRWHLRKAHAQMAVDTVNQIIRRAGSRVPPLTVAALGDNVQSFNEQLPPYWALFRPGQLRWTAVGIVTFVCASTAFFLISVLLPKALVDQHMAVGLSFGVSSLVFAASIPGKGFTGYLMEVIGRRWTIAYALLGSLPGLFLMLLAHRAGSYETVLMAAGALMTGFTALSSATAFRVYLSEQFPTSLRGRGHFFGESFARVFSGVLAPFLMEPHGRLGDDLLRHDFGGRGDRRLHPAGLRPRDRWPAGNGDREAAGTGLRRRSGARQAIAQGSHQAPQDLDSGVVFVVRLDQDPGRDRGAGALDHVGAACW